MPKLSDFSTGFSPGLATCLFFTLGFYLVGYRLPLSACLGILGGVASGVVIAWWRFEEIEKISASSLSESGTIVPLREPSKTEIKARQTNLSTNPPHRATSLLHWLFGRR